MANLDFIISRIEEFAPPDLAEEWDNSGWQVYLGNKNINKIMLALSPTPNVIRNAVIAGCELLITHHFLSFSALDHNNLQIYSAHTNLDFASGGIADRLAELLQLKNNKLAHPESLSIVVDRVKKVLNAPVVRLVNPLNIKKVQRIAVMPGSGGGLISGLRDIDLYITGDVKYHDALEAEGFAVIDAGHFETERIILPVLKDLLDGLGAEVFIADEPPPFVYV